ncbi:tetratricopeptide repeat protein [Pelagicoccus mobilis]|uniref:Tetratricopeptide repeat protein n=1 Tax=Pelagicoccus mobilis TaxID=415221 RepID=A0A934S0H0_9BACT|nr:tetratricopeptide repeat protein [Pelagicoccus mobilis]MBK1878925.1 tetratricopeptide repeat protein [Pelagicoccus mobilis]
MKLKLSLAALLILVAAGGFLLWQKSAQTTALIAQAAPQVPAAQISNPELLDRIQNATTEANEGQLDGLAELSRLYHANGFTNEAWQCYATLVLVDPSQARWPYRFGRILAGYGQLEEATPLFEDTIKLDSKYLPARIRLGDTLLKQNRFEEARRVYQDTLSLDEQNPYALVGLARVAIAKEDWKEARAHLELAVKASDFQIGADLLGDVYEKLDLPALENRVLQNIEWGSYADIPDPWSLTLMDDSYDAYQVSIAGGWAAHQGDVRTGLRYAQRAIKLDPDSSTLHYQIAGLYQNLENDKKAEEHYRRCVELQPDFSDAWLGLIEIAKRRNSPTHLRRTLDAALKAAPESPSLNIERGKLLVAQKQFEKAYPYFVKSIENRPHEAVGYIALAQAYLADNRIEDGVAQMRLALVQEPANPVALSSMVFDAIVRKDKAEADQWFTRLRQQVRFRDQEIAQLETMYQQTFGTRP